MKRIFNKFYIIGALVVLGACNEDIIETTPQQSITPEIALEDLDGLEAVLFASYNGQHAFNYYGQDANINPEILADNLVIANNTGRYTGQVVNAVGSHINRWNRYGTMNDINIVIKRVDDYVDEPQSRRDAIKGEALFLRALNYHDMVKVYGYEPGREVNGWNAGVILRTDPVETVSDANFQARATNLEVYNQIETDLIAAINLLPAGSGTSDYPYRVSREAAQLLLARVYLYWGRYGEAATLADQAIAGAGVGLVAAADYETSFGTVPHPESLFEIEIRSVDWSTVDGINNSMCSLASTIFPNSQFVVAASNELVAAHEVGDIRATLWVDADNSGRLQSRKWQGEKGDFLENIPVLRLSEAYLISAEGHARNNNENSARASINALRAERGLGNTAATGSALTDLIMNERRVELALEGHRWYDLKRLGMDISKPASLGVLPVLYEDFRILGIIPADQVLLNSELVQNPGY